MTATSTPALGYHGTVPQPTSSRTSALPAWLAPLVTDRVALGLALAPVALLPFALGGVHPQVALAATVVECVAFAVWCGHRMLRRAPLPLHWAMAPLLLGVVATVWELCPLPASVRGFIAPKLVRDIAFVTQPLADAVRDNIDGVLAADPPETRFALMRLLGALLLFTMVAHAAQSRRGRALVYRVLCATALMLFAVAALHRLLGVYGAWGTFTMKATTFYAPMVNPNQLGRVFGALSVVCGMRAIGVRSKREAAIMALTFVVCGAAVILTSSRGAVLAYGVAVVVALWVMWRDGRHASLTVADVVWRGAVGLGGAAAAAWAAAPGLRALFASEGTSINTSKLSLYAPTLQMIAEHPLGVGNNGFRSVFTIYTGPPVNGQRVTFSNVENAVLAALSEHGVVVGSVLLALCAALAVWLVVVLATRSRATALPALALLASGEMLDFALETSAGLFLATTLLALCVARAPRLHWWRVPLRVGAIGLGVVFLLLLWVAPSAIGQWRRRQDADIARAHGAAQGDLVMQALAAHPHDGHFAYLMAVQAREARDAKRALLWANRAINVWPQHDGAHVEAARALAAQGHLHQALLEYQLAWSAGGNHAQLLLEVAKRTPDYLQRRRAVPDVDLGAVCNTLFAEARLSDALVCFDDVLALDGDAQHSDVLWARLRAADIAKRIGDVDGAMRRLKPATQSDTVSGDVAQAWLRLLEEARGLPAARIAALELTERTVPASAIFQWRLDAAIRAADAVDAQATLRQLRLFAPDYETQGQLDLKEAAIAHLAHDKTRRLTMLRSITARNSSNAAAWLDLADAEWDLRFVDKAAAALDAALAAGAAPAAVDALRTRLSAAPRP